MRDLNENKFTDLFKQAAEKYYGFPYTHGMEMINIPFIGFWLIAENTRKVK